MKYLKYFEQASAYEAYKNGSDYVTPNVSYVVETNSIAYNPFAEAKSGVIMARYNATEENKLAIADTSNVKSLKVNGTEVEFSNMYYFSEVGEYDVEIELIDPTLINGADMNSDMPPKSMFWGILDNGPTGACLTSIILPEGIITIGLHAFCECKSLTSVIIPNSATYIGDNAFNTCSNLNDIHIGSGVTNVGYYAFDCCTSLPVIDNLRYADTYLVGAVDKTLSTYTIKESTKWIGDNAFAGCSGLTSINIPDSVNSIGYYAFQNCSNLTSITIPYSVTSIGFRAFCNCTSLTGELVIPDSVTTIREQAFIDCSGLTSVVIGSGVTSIGETAFGGCSKLTSVVIGSGVKTIDNNVFINCSSLNEITCNAIIAPEINSYTFKDVKVNGILKVPAGSDYSAWMNYLNKYNWTIEYI